jgi:hypothetical protein
MRAAIPVVPRIEAHISAAERARLKALAGECLAAERGLSSITHFGPRVRCGLESGPALLIEDRSEIVLAGTPEQWQLEYRLALLADSRDMLVISGKRCLEFESYISRLLGISNLDVIIAKRAGAGRVSPMPRRCADQEQILRHIAAVARAAGRLTIVPDNATGHVWNLAHAISRAAGLRVFVAAAPPRLSRQVNNKLWFADRVKDVLGEEAHPPSRSAFGPAVLAAHVQRLSREYERLIIKLPDSAGSAGNLVLASEDYRHVSLPALRQRLMQLLRLFGPNWRFPLKIEVWDSPVLSSPSVQIWIPHRKVGAPVVEGAFEQVVEGEKGEFVGATRAHLPALWRRRLADEAVCLAALLQELGYFGRCSFDAVITGDNFDTAQLHWIECNGRWGGVSVPMTFANRLGAAVSESEIVIVQRTTFEAPPRSFRDVLSLFSDLLFEPGRSTEGLIPLTPGGFARGAGAHFMTIAKSLERAKDLARRALQRLAGA